MWWNLKRMLTDRQCRTAHIGAMAVPGGTIATQPGTMVTAGGTKVDGIRNLPSRSDSVSETLIDAIDLTAAVAMIAGTGLNAAINTSEMAILAIVIAACCPRVATKSASVAEVANLSLPLGFSMRLFLVAIGRHSASATSIKARFGGPFFICGNATRLWLRFSRGLSRSPGTL